MQEDEFLGTKQIFKNGMPHHQMMFYSGAKSILAFGFIDMGGGQFYQWSLFGEHIKKHHMIFIIKYVRQYLNMLDYKYVHHIIRKDLPWTAKAMKALGYKYVRDEDEFTEHWIRVR